MKKKKWWNQDHRIPNQNYRLIFPTHSENTETEGKVPQGGPKPGPCDAQSFSSSTLQFGWFCEGLHLELRANSSLQCVELHKYLMTVR